MSKDYPFYQQRDAMDCGATCLRMVAKYHGKYYELPRLRQLTNSSTQGVSIYGISKAANEIGMQTLEAAVSFNRLIDDIPFPIIAHWEEDHFIVVYEATAKGVLVADPARGLIKMSPTEFMQGWSYGTDPEANGLIIVLEPTPEFYQKEGQEIDRTNWRYLLQYFRRYKSLGIQLLAGVAVGVLGAIFFPFFLRAIIDEGIPNHDFNFISLVIVCWFILMAGYLAVRFFRAYLLQYIAVRVNMRLVSDFLVKVTKLPLRTFGVWQSNDILRRVEDHAFLERFVSVSGLTTLFAVTQLLVFSLILGIFDWTLLLVYLLFAGANVLWYLYFLRRRKRLRYRSMDQAFDSYHKLHELISGMQTIKMHNATHTKRIDWEREEIKAARLELRDYGNKTIQQSGSEFLHESAFLLIILLAAKMVMEGELTLGALVATLYILVQLRDPLHRLLLFFTEWQAAQMSLERMNEVFLWANEENNGPQLTVLPQQQDIHVDELTFSYDGNEGLEVLRKVNLTIPMGSKVAVVGSSGSGKTTLLKLLLKIYEPTEGDIKLGDISLNNFSHELWRSKCGVVMQEDFLFDDSILKNIVISEQEVDTVRLFQAVRMANIQGFIESLPMGYDTQIGASGMGLSAGEKQRLFLARMIYKNPDYVFMDEATSLLDSFNEMIILENMETWLRERTTFMVAHRLSTVVDADLIYVLENGEIIEQGNHDSLMKARGAYYHLVQKQLELG